MSLEEFNGQAARVPEVSVDFRTRSGKCALDHCVELGYTGEPGDGAQPVSVRDSKDPGGPEFYFGVPDMRHLIRDVKRGEYDLPA